MKQRILVPQMILLLVGCIGIAYTGSKIVTDGITTLRALTLGAYLFAIIVNAIMLIRD